MVYPPRSESQTVQPNNHRVVLPSPLNSDLTTFLQLLFRQYTIRVFTWAYSHKIKTITMMKYNFIRTRLVKIVCGCCGRNFYAEAGINFCSECEETWNNN